VRLLRTQVAQHLAYCVRVNACLLNPHTSHGIEMRRAHVKYLGFEP
jgi:hypothetical protein